MESKNRYIYGSAAPQMPQRQEQKQPVRKQEVRVAPRPAPRYAHVPKAKLFLAITVLVVMCFVILYRFTSLSQLNYQMGVLTNQYDQLRDQNRKLKVDIETSINLDNVKAAAEGLGMHKPDKFQIIPVNVPKNNYSVVLNEQYIQEAQDTGGNFIDNAIAALKAAF